MKASQTAAVAGAGCDERFPAPWAARRSSRTTPPPRVDDNDSPSTRRAAASGPRDRPVRGVAPSDSSPTSTTSSADARANRGASTSRSFRNGFVSLHGNPILETAHLPDGRQAQIRVGIAEDGYVADE